MRSTYVSRPNGQTKGLEPSRGIEPLYPEYETGVIPLYDDGVNSTI
jgi:hypothetical protein